MNWRFADPTKEFSRFAEAFDTLAERSFRSHPMLCSAFIQPLIDYFAAPGSLLCLSSDGGEVNGFVLLTKRQPGVWSAFLPSQAQIAPAVLPSGTDLRGLIRQLPGTNLAIEMSCQDPHYSFLIPESPGANMEVVEHVVTMNIELKGDFDAYCQSRSNKLRNNIGRYWRRLERERNAYRLEVISDSDALQEGLVRYGDMESAGWKGKKGTAISQENMQGQFYADVLRRFAQIGGARIYELYFDNRLAASRICICSNKMLIMMKTTYDEDSAKLAPGRLLLHAVLEREFAQKQFEVIEFYTNATRDQLSWATGSRPIYHLTQFRNAAIKAVVGVSRPVRHWVDSIRNHGSCGANN